MLTYDFRLPPGPRTVEYALLAEELGFRAVWCPEIPAFGHDIWVTLARIAEKTKRIRFGPSVLIPSYRHPMAQASAIATLEQITPGRLMVGFGTGFTGFHAFRVGRVPGVIGERDERFDGGRGARRSDVLAIIENRAVGWTRGKSRTLRPARRAKSGHR